VMEKGFGTLQAGEVLGETTSGAAGSGLSSSTASYKYDNAGGLMSRTGPEGTST